MLHFECPVCQPVQPYIQPNFVVSAKIRLIRISAEKFVQPAKFLKIRQRGLLLHTLLLKCYYFSRRQLTKLLYVLPINKYAIND